MHNLSAATSDFPAAIIDCHRKIARRVRTEHRLKAYATLRRVAQSLRVQGDSSRVMALRDRSTVLKTM
jgi:hypothetical protein